MARLRNAWRGLDGNQRLAGGAAAALFVSMLLPWYTERFPTRTERVSAFGSFSFVEAAVLLVAVAVLALLFARGEGKGFHLPGGDGTILLVAGAWVAVLIVYRLFDTPDEPGIRVGTFWGIWIALAIAGALAYAGLRVRAAHRPEPPLPPRARAVPPDRPVRPPATEADTSNPRVDVPPTGATERLRDPPTPPGEQLALDDTPDAIHGGRRPAGG